MPYDLEKFTTCASALLADQLTNVVDIHYRQRAEPWGHGGADARRWWAS